MQDLIYWTYKILVYTDLLIFLGLAVTLIIYFKKLPQALKILTFLVTLLCFIGITVNILSTLGIRNTCFIHVLLFLQLTGFTFYYKELFGNTKSAIVVAVAGVAVFIFYAIFYIVNWKDIIWQLGGTTYSISTLLFIGYAIYYYFYTLKGIRLPYPLINAAVLIYFATTSIVFLFGNQLQKMPPQPLRIIWILNVLVHMLFVLLIFADVWKTLRLNRKTL